jgi:hypothetical protein
VDNIQILSNESQKSRLSNELAERIRNNKLAFDKTIEAIETDQMRTDQMSSQEVNSTKSDHIIDFEQEIDSLKTVNKTEQSNPVENPVIQISSTTDDEPAQMSKRKSQRTRKVPAKWRDEDFQFDEEVETMIKDDPKPAALTALNSTISESDEDFAGFDLENSPRKATKAEEVVTEENIPVLVLQEEEFNKLTPRKARFKKQPPESMSGELNVSTSAAGLSVVSKVLKITGELSEVEAICAIIANYKSVAI